MKPTSLFEVVKELPIYQERVKTLEPFKEQYLGLTNLTKTYPLNNMGIKMIRKLAEQGMVSCKKKGNHTLFSVYDFHHYNIAVDAFLEVYAKALEFFLAIGYDKVSQNLYPYSIEPKLKTMHQKGYIKTVELEHPIDSYCLYIKKSEIERFIESHISHATALKEANVSYATFKQSWMKEYPHESIVVMPLKEFMFLKRKDWESFRKARKREGYITKEKAARQLGITSNNLEKVCKEYKISLFSIKNAKHLSTESFSFLVKEQMKKWEEFKTIYYTTEEAAEELGILKSSLSNLKEKLKPISVPPLICIKKDGYNFRTRKQYIFQREIIQALIENRDEEEKLNMVFQMLDADPFQQFQTYMQEANLHFKGPQTQKYWYHYVRQKLYSSNSSENTRKATMRVYINASMLLVRLTETKEIYMYSSNELNLAIFNLKVNKTTQLELYKFLREISKTRIESGKEIRFKFDRLINVYQQKTSKSLDKSIYSIDEYLSLINYCNDVPTIKKKVIEDIYSLLSENEYKQLDSVWLYVLLHLNNAWRHQDVVNFPRIDFKHTSLEKMTPTNALKWLETNNLSQLDVQNILNQVYAMKLIHSKTNKRRYFFCSNELKESVATALVLCELRCRLHSPLYTTIIDFDNRKQSLKRTQQRSFFADFSKNFMFQSKKMNRSLISYVYNVIQKTTNRNPLEITKFIRSHSSVEVTNIYVDIPQEQLDFISNQLFALGHFGYAYDALSQMVLPEKSQQGDRETQTNNALIIKKVFGDVIQIEETMRYIKALSKEQDNVRKVLEGLPIETLNETYKRIQIGEQPGKSEGFQCLFQSCPHPHKSCSSCSFAVPHFYALSQLGDDYNRKFSEFKTKMNENIKIGEKIRLSNQLYGYLYLISLAVKRFGKEFVSPFFEVGLDEVKVQLKELPSTKDFVSIDKFK